MNRAIPLVGGVTSLAVGAGVAYFVALPYVMSNAPSEWAWILGPVLAFVVGAVIAGIGWFITVLAIQASLLSDF